MGGINNNEYMMQVIELKLVIGNRNKEVIKEKDEPTMQLLVAAWKVVFLLFL